MSRLIDADLIQYELMLSAKGDGMYEDVMVAYKSQIDDLPTIEERWIPCSEILPDTNGRYIVTRGLKACNAIWNRVYIINYSDLMGLKAEKIWWDGNVGKSDFQIIDDVIAGKNYASYLVAHSLKMLPNRTFVVSYADTAWSHVGYIYQATNFLYTGMSAKRLDTYQPGGLHPRAYDKNNHSKLKQTRSRKHRYVYLVGDKRTKREMRKELKYPVIDKYPKGDERPYDPENPVAVEQIKIVGE